MDLNFCPNCGTPVGDRTSGECDECGQDFHEPDTWTADELEESVDDCDGNVEPQLGQSHNTDDHRFAASPSDHQASSAIVYDAPQKRKWWEPVVVVLRWIGFIPIGILGGIAAGIICYFFFGAGSWLTGFPFDSPWNRLMVAGISGYTSVFFGAHVAPIVYKAVPAIVMGVLMFMMCGVAIVVHIDDRQWFQIIQCIVSVVAAAGSMYQIIEETRPNGT